MSLACMVVPPATACNSAKTATANLFDGIRNLEWDITDVAAKEVDIPCAIRSDC